VVKYFLERRPLSKSQARRFGEVQGGESVHFAVTRELEREETFIDNVHVGPRFHLYLLMNVMFQVIYIGILYLHWEIIVAVLC